MGGQLLSCFREAFDCPDIDALTPSQKIGVITLLHKGNGLPRDQPASYRPITLLNTDYKVLARALACRWGVAADEVVDQTQTAFIPNRWIGDNVLAHLEEIDFCQSCQVEGTILFIDSAKAYDRLDMGWVLRCLQGFGFGPRPNAGCLSFTAVAMHACASTVGALRSSPSSQGSHKGARSPRCCMF